MAVRKLFSFAVISLCAMHLAGCTTSATGIAPTAADPSMASFAPLPDLVSAPVPTARPDTPQALASLAADMENQTETSAQPLQAAAGGQPASTAMATDKTGTQPVMNAMALPGAPGKEVAVAIPASYAPQDKSAQAIVAVAVPQKPVIPQDAVDIANAAPVTEAAVSGGKGARECLMRAMYFESNRSSRDGQLAVGTVVMNRVAHGAWGKSVCGVVGARQQFAPGVMSRRMQGDTSDLSALADAILSGKRHPKLAGNVMYFHVAGMKFKYKNMHYVLVAGGNTFYYKAGRRRG